MKTENSYLQQSVEVISLFQVCPLQGGYLVEWFDEDGKASCNATIEPLKFENECSVMEGIRFHSVKQKCPIPGEYFRLETLDS